MKWIVVAVCLVSTAWAESSKVIPALVEAAEIYVQGRERDNLYLRPDVLKVLQVLQSKDLSLDLVERRILNKNKQQWLLPADDQFDAWIKNPERTKAQLPELALHAVRFDVIQASQRFFKDDIYTYYFITDGVIPTGKVSSIYKAIGSGQSFFFNETDRAIYPLLGVPAKAPENHLIVDYGIVESDGDDIKDLQKLSSVIIDIAIAAYSVYNPQHAPVVVNLRKEVKALADMLLTMNNDDRLVTNSFGYKADELAQLMEAHSYVEFKKNHKSNSRFEKWEYDIHFRLLRK